jgi:hypothetical protein
MRSRSALRRTTHSACEPGGTRPGPPAITSCSAFVRSTGGTKRQALHQVRRLVAATAQVPPAWLVLAGPPERERVAIESLHGQMRGIHQRAALLVGTRFRKSFSVGFSSLRDFFVGILGSPNF